MKTVLLTLALALLTGACTSEQPNKRVTNDTSATKVVPEAKPAKLGDTANVTRAGDIWFAAQPSEGDWKAVTDAGIKRVIDLRDKDEDRGYDESAKADELGLDYAVFEVNKQGFSPEVIEPAVKALEEAEKSWHGPLKLCQLDVESSHCIEGGFSHEEEAHTGTDRDETAGSRRPSSRRHDRARRLQAA